MDTFSKSTDDTKLGAVSDALEHLAAIQKFLERLKKLANRNLVQLNKIKCHILGRNNSKHHYRLGSSSLKKDLDITDKLCANNAPLQQSRPTVCSTALSRVSPGGQGR